jgi:hypothetical protein
MSICSLIYSKVKLDKYGFGNKIYMYFILNNNDEEDLNLSIYNFGASYWIC